jgi:hypothetical protein
VQKRFCLEAKGGGQERKGTKGRGGEMTQIMYAQLNKKIKIKKKRITTDVLAQTKARKTWSNRMKTLRENDFQP